MRAVIFRCGTIIVLAFKATKANGVMLNAWSCANDKKWCPPYPIYIEGCQLHSLYLDMRLGMRPAALAAITDMITVKGRDGQVPCKVLVTEHSIRGGIST